MLRHLSIRDFRCFPRFDLDFDPEITCIIGGNALGKTSLLEAVAVLTRLQSPRTNSLSPVIRTGAKGLVVDGMVENRHLQFYYSKAGENWRSTRSNKKMLTNISRSPG